MINITTERAGMPPNKTVIWISLFFVLAIVLLAVYLAMSSGEGVSPLMRAAKLGDSKEISRLIADGANVNQISKYGWTVLIFASRAGNERVVEQLLNANADPNIVSVEVDSTFETTAGYMPTTALAEAIHSHHLNVVHLLLRRGAKLDKLSIALAGEFGNIDLLHYIEKLGGDFNQYSGVEYFPTALCSAIARGNLKTVRWLIEHGADINLVSHHTSPIRSAVKSLNPEIISYLLEKGADPNKPYGDPSYIHSFPLGNIAIKSISDPEKSRRTINVIQLLLKHGVYPRIIKRVLAEKKMQFENGQRYQEQYRAGDNVDLEVLERFRKSNQHDNALIKLLENWVFLTTVKVSRPSVRRKDDG